MSPDEQMQIRPIGTVENGIYRRPHWAWSGVRSIINVHPPYREAMKGLSEHTHLYVLFWFHRLEAGDRATTRVHPMGRRELPLTGVFATHSPARPNPIGLTVCRLLEVGDLALYVEDLDALHGTPVIDIKGYSGGDARAGPGWQVRNSPSESPREPRPNAPEGS